MNCLHLVFVKSLTLHNTYTLQLFYIRLTCAPQIIYILFLFFCTYFTRCDNFENIRTLLTHAFCRAHIAFHMIYTEFTPCSACALQWVCICFYNEFAHCRHALYTAFTSALHKVKSCLHIVYTRFATVFKHTFLFTWALKFTCCLHTPHRYNVFLRFTHRRRMSHWLFFFFINTGKLKCYHQFRILAKLCSVQYNKA